MPDYEIDGIRIMLQLSGILRKKRQQTVNSDVDFNPSQANRSFKPKSVYCDHKRDANIDLNG